METEFEKIHKKYTEKRRELEILKKEVEELENEFIKIINERLKKNIQDEFYKTYKYDEHINLPECCQNCQSYLQSLATNTPLICHCTLPYMTRTGIIKTDIIQNNNIDNKYEDYSFSLINKLDGNLNLKLIFKPQQDLQGIEYSFIIKDDK